MRLAYEQGLLKGRSISPYQAWALEYMLSVKRWFIREVQDSALQNLLFMLDPARWKTLFAPELPAPDVDDPELGESVPVSTEDIGKWLETQLAGEKQLSGADVQGPEDGWQ